MVVCFPKCDSLIIEAGSCKPRGRESVHLGAVESILHPWSYLLFHAWCKVIQVVSLQSPHCHNKHRWDFLVYIGVSRGRMSNDLTTCSSAWQHGLPVVDRSLTDFLTVSFISFYPFALIRMALGVSELEKFEMAWSIRIKKSTYIYYLLFRDLIKEILF